MAFVHVQCPECHSTDVVQYGKQANGAQRYRCNSLDCPRTIFLLQYQDKGRLPAVKQQSVDMTLNGSGVRDIVRVLGVRSATVIAVLKKTRMANLTGVRYEQGVFRSSTCAKLVHSSDISSKMTREQLMGQRSRTPQAEFAILEKKEPAVKQVNERLLKRLDPEQLASGMRLRAEWGMMFPQEDGIAVALPALPQLRGVPAREPETFSSSRHNPSVGAGKAQEETPPLLPPGQGGRRGSRRDHGRTLS